MAWWEKSLLRKSCLWLGANVCASLRCQKKLDIWDGTEGEALSETTVEKQQKENFQATVFKQKKGERVAALVIVPTTVYGYTMQNGLDPFRSGNSSLINVALNVQEIVPAAMRLREYVGNWQAQEHRGKNAAIFVGAFYFCVSSAAPFFQGNLCAYDQLNLDGSSAFHVMGNWLSSGTVAVLYLPGAYDWLQSLFTTLTDEEKQTQMLDSLTDEILRFSVSAGDIKELVGILNSDDKRSIVDKITAVETICQRHRTCLPSSGKAHQALQVLEFLAKVAIVATPWLAQSLSVYTFFHAMPKHGYGLFAPMRWAMRIPYAGYPIALAMNAPQGIFDWKLFSQGRQGIVYDFLSIGRVASFALGLTRLLAWGLGMFSTEQSVFVFSGQSACGAEFTSEDPVYNFFQSIFSAAGGAKFLEVMSELDAFVINAKGNVGLWMPLMTILLVGLPIALSTCCTSRCSASRTGTALDALSRAKNAVHFQRYKNTLSSAAPEPEV